MEAKVEYHSCNETDGFCEALQKRMNIVGHHGKGIVPVMVMTKSYTDMKTVGAMYKESAKDRGLMFNHCPWCGESLRWFDKKESEQVDAKGDK